LISSAQDLNMLRMHSGRMENNLSRTVLKPCDFEV
jgi:hypothetical protein